MVRYNYVGCFAFSLKDPTRPIERIRGIRG
jgi:hypothetical protein